MQDMLIKANADGIYDLVIDGSDFASAEGFETAIPTSYFTDARAPAVQVQEAKNRRGWAGNILSADIERELGGLLWILDQARIIEDVLNFGKSFAEDSIQWMLDDGEARNVAVTVEQQDDSSVKIFTSITTPDNTVLKYVSLWRKTDFTRSQT